MQQIDDLILQKCVGKGSFGEVYISTKRGSSKYYATKKFERKTVDKPSLKKYFENEIQILRSLNHPNIVKLVEVKKSTQHYYIVMEYINGGGLSNCLKKYMDKYKKAFPEEIVQHLMRQIIDALHYIHKNKIIHRDLKLDNIMVNFDTEKDKENLNMINAKIKIIDFGFATKLTPEKNDLTFSAVGSPINMDPIILAKFVKGKDMSIMNAGYDDKADIWSIGTVCYELLIGKAVFNASTLGDLVEKVEEGKYTVPSSLSKEVVSFLNGMLQYDSKLRLNSEELLKHPFLTKNCADFTRINAAKASKNKNSNIKNNKSIWAIYADEDKLTKIEGGKDLSMAPIAEEENFRNEGQFNIDRKEGRNRSNPKQYNNNLHKMKTNNINNNPNIPNYKNINYNNRNSEKLRRIQTFNNYPITSFYGQSMNPISQQSIPQMGMPNTLINYQHQPMMQYPSFGVGMPYNNYVGFYNNHPNSAQVNPPANNKKKTSHKNLNYKKIYQDTKYESDCNIF